MKQYDAILNGTPCKARKMGRHWLVGGDFVSPGDLVSIVIERDGRPAWYNLRGAVVRFSDWASPVELHDIFEKS